MLMTVREMAIDAQCVSIFFLGGGGKAVERRPLFYLSSILRTLRTMFQLSENLECQPGFEPGAAW